MGVSAENQRNLTVKNTVSYFKNFLGRKFKDEYVQRKIGQVGAEVVELQNEQPGFRVQGEDYRPEQLLAMMFTKVRDIVRQDQGEEIATCVVSVPVYFTETQRSAVLDAGKVAGLPVVQLMNDTSALALAYGKTKSEELEEDEAKPRYVVLVDVGASGVQSSLVGVSKRKATVLGTSWSNSTGGSSLDAALRAHIVAEIEKKYKVKLEGNSKALNKLGIAVEKVKKQMSANSNKLPMQIDSLVEDTDVSVTVDRATFEQLAQQQLEEVRSCLLSLLQATTVRREQLHSVELVGGSGRMPAIKQIIQEVFGITPTSSLNADEAVSKGCGLQAASHSDKFRTKRFEVQEVVSRGVEAVYVHDGNQEKVLVCDEGDNGTASKSLSIRADLPISIALQYAENVAAVDNRFIALYQIESENRRNADLELGFKLDKNGMIKMEKVQLLTKEASKRRRTSEGDGSVEGPMVELRFSETTLGGFPEEVVARLKEAEERMQHQDTKEIARQEAKNMLEEQLYKYRATVVAEADQLEKEQAYQQIKEYFDQTENWLYEEGEDAPQQTYESILKSFHDKMGVFQMWKSKYLQMKAKEEEKRQFLEVQAQQPQQRTRSPTSRQIPVVYEGEGPYVRSQQQHEQCAPTRQGPPTGDHGYSRPGPTEPFMEHADQNNRGQRLRRPQLPEDPFNGFRRSSFFNDPLFGW
jgi:heat shock protein